MFLNGLSWLAEISKLSEETFLKIAAASGNIESFYSICG